MVLLPLRSIFARLTNFQVALDNPRGTALVCVPNDSPPAPKQTGRIEAEAPRRLLRHRRGDVLGVGCRPYRHSTVPSRVRYRARTFAPRRISRRLPLRLAPHARCAPDPLWSGLGRARTAPPATVACFARRLAG